MKDNDFLGKDKLKHFLVCLFMGFFSTKFAMGLALGKEVGDYFNPNSHWCWWDLFYDMLGIIGGTAVRCLIMHEFNIL